MCCSEQKAVLCKQSFSQSVPATEGPSAQIHSAAHSALFLCPLHYCVLFQKRGPGRDGEGTIVGGWVEF